MSDFPPYYDSLGGSLAEAWRQIEDGAVNRRSQFHTMVLATIGLDAAPSARTVVLRAASRHDRTLRFHTDIRAGKIAEIQTNPRVCLHLYSPDTKLQVRLLGHAVIHQDDDVADAAWAATKSMSRLCYRVSPDSALPLLSPYDADFSATDDMARQVFAAITVQVESLEWLYLHAKGHRRAYYEWDDFGELTATWRVP